MSKSIQILLFTSLHYSRLFHQMLRGYRLSIRFGYVKLVRVDRHFNQFLFVNVSTINVYFVCFWLYSFVFNDSYDSINVREVLPHKLSKNCTQLSIYQIDIFLNSRLNYHPNNKNTVLPNEARSRLEQKKLRIIERILKISL